MAAVLTIIKKSCIINLAFPKRIRYGASQLVQNAIVVNKLRKSKPHKPNQGMCGFLFIQTNYKWNGPKKLQGFLEGTH